jgi:hypothetical protein
MIQKIDRLWFEFLRAMYRWMVRRAEAHSRREKQRRFRRLMSAQNTWKN